MDIGDGLIVIVAFFRFVFLTTCFVDREVLIGFNVGAGVRVFIGFKVGILV